MFPMQAAAVSTQCSTHVFPLAQILRTPLSTLQESPSVPCGLAANSLILANDSRKNSFLRKGYCFEKTGFSALHNHHSPKSKCFKQYALITHSSISEEKSETTIANGHSFSDSTTTSTEKEDGFRGINLNTRLTARLSEANAYNRFLKRQLQKEGEVLDSFTKDLVNMEKELKELSEIAYEASFNGGKPFRKINGKYLPSYIALKVDEILQLVSRKSEEAKLLQLQEIPVVWLGMAEDVKIMGSFDSWTKGKHMSPESTGSVTKFTTTLSLRPGRYLVKFLVDGKWQLAPEWETEGSGFNANNVLVVE